MSQLFTMGGQSIWASASASVPPMNIQGWFPLGLTGLISLQSKGPSRAFSKPQFQSISYSVLRSDFHIHTRMLSIGRVVKEVTEVTGPDVTVFYAIRWVWRLLSEREIHYIISNRRVLEFELHYKRITLAAVMREAFRNQFSSVTQSCLTLCDPMDCSMPGFPVHHQLPELTQTHVHLVSDAIQPCPLLFLPSVFLSTGFVLVSQFFTSGSQSMGVSASASVLPVNIQNWSPLGWTSWISLQSKGLSRVFSNSTFQTHQSLVLSFLY